MTRLRPGAALTATPTALDQEGAGLAFESDGRIHIAGALPGETVDVVIEHVSPHLRAGQTEAWARVDGLVRTSADRVPPACPAYGRCGGCPMQHLRYEAQVAWKGERVTALFANAPELSGARVAPCVPSPHPLGYRNQAKYVYGYTREGRLVLGAYAPRSHEIVDLTGCRLLEPPLDAVARGLRDRLESRTVAPFEERTRAGQLRYVALRANASGQVLVTFVTAHEDWPAGEELAADVMRSFPAVAGVVQNVNPTTGNVLFGRDERTLGGQDHLQDQIAGARVRLSSRAFFQLNRSVAAIAYDRIRAAVATAGPVEVAVDAYAGVGGIALVLAPLARSVVAIEENPAATAAGTLAAEAGGSSGVRFVTADSARGLLAMDRADVVVLNPPRAGCAPPVLEAAGRLRPRLLAYLSCNPTTLTRDLGALLRAGLRLETVTPLDMLPHTPHVEVLALLAGP